MDDSRTIFKGELLFQTTRRNTPGCSWCHTVKRSPDFEDFGTEERFNGPALVGVMDRHSEAFVRDQILHGGGAMPAREPYLDLDSQDDLGCDALDKIVAYLHSLGDGEVLMSDVEMRVEQSLADDGASIFADHCETCHLDGGRSPGSGQSFSPQPPELKHVLMRHGPEFAIEIITRDKGNMPAYGPELSDEEIASLIEYLESLAEE